LPHPTIRNRMKSARIEPRFGELAGADRLP
jgi:hypothetical protein